MSCGRERLKRAKAARLQMVLVPVMVHLRALCLELKPVTLCFPHADHRP